MITIKRIAYDKMDTYSKDTKRGEIGWLLLGNIDKFGNITVEDTHLLKQVKTNSTFEFDDNALMEITKNWTGKRLAKILGWGHSHCEMGCFWSSVDDDTFERLCNLNGLCLGIVVAHPRKSTEMEIKCRVRLTNKNNIQVDVDDIKADVEVITYYGKNYFSKFDYIRDEIKDLVTEDDRIHYVCNTCKGMGYTTGKRSKKTKMLDYDKDDDYEKYEKDRYGYMGIYDW